MAVETSLTLFPSIALLDADPGIRNYWLVSLRNPSDAIATLILSLIIFPDESVNAESSPIKIFTSLHNINRREINHLSFQ
ncbi:hypothetical protein Y032_0550g3315 [Ancylostoma ceylanicum]|uniref:Uncharacterized protein n=1 Tax=Ancylostoma ceylanicum TaxID=53326 RepID=A0A016WSF9_9BILA|nr:hypothetical protein Y032_0550g3315 [Ancylostoma ceylanicum]